jgi:hypothetical protein
MSDLEEAKKKAASPYNAASDFYDHPAMGTHFRSDAVLERLAAADLTDRQADAASDSPTGQRTEIWWAMIMFQVIP